MDTPDTLIAVPRRRGRPRSQEKSTPIMTRVPDSVVDKLCALARDQRVSVSKAASRILILQLTGKSR